MNGEEYGRRFALAREDGYVRVEWTEGATVSERDALDIIAELSELIPDRCEPMLVILNSMVSVKSPALSLFASNLNVAALALVGPSAVDRIIAVFFNDVHNPRYPTRYFPVPAPAIDWLLMPGHGTPETG